MQEILEKEILSSIKKLFPETDDSGISVDVSDNFGDYASNAAMVLSKRVGKSPRDVADELVKALEEKKIKLVEKIEVAGPGFINFYIEDKFFVDSVAEILEKPPFRSEVVSSSKKTLEIMIEKGFFEF